MVQRLIFGLLTLLVALAVCLPLAWAQRQIEIDISGPGQQGLNIYTPSAVNLDGGSPPKMAQDLRQDILDNLSYLPFLSKTSGQVLLGGPELSGVQKGDLDFKRFRLARIDLLLSIGWQEQASGGIAELRLFDVFSKRRLLGKGYRVRSQGQVKLVADRFCAQVLEELAGNGDFFRSRLSFVRAQDGAKDIWTVTPQGSKLQRVTDLPGLCMSPAWSWDGREIVFTYLDERRHRLGIWKRRSDRLETVILPGNTLISPVFSPQGSIVISLDPYGNPDIFVLDEDQEIKTPLIRNWGIDISPHFDRSGNKMVFVSSRLGNPHIFVLDLKADSIRRISFEGTYNTSPSISPSGRFVAYSRRTEQGHRIVVYDSETGRSRQVSNGPGDDEDPTWAPDGYFLAFCSNRSGKYKLYITTRNGDSPRQIPTGGQEALAPSWSPRLAD